MSKVSIAGINVVTLAVLLIASTLAFANPSNKWRLQFSGGSDSDGVITIVLKPVGGTPITAVLSIEDDTSENSVAKAVVEQLQKILPEDGYHVERDDGEDVLIKKRSGAADFDLEIVSNTVKGVRINPDRE